MRRTRLQRRTPLEARKGLDRRGRLNPVSARRRRRDASYPKAREYVYTRSRGACEARAHADGCSGRTEQVHHIAGRGGPDPHRPDNLLGVSAACHTEIHANPERSYRLGLMIRRVT